MTLRDVSPSGIVTSTSSSIGPAEAPAASERGARAGDRLRRRCCRSSPRRRRTPERSPAGSVSVTVVGPTVARRAEVLDVEGPRVRGVGAGPEARPVRLVDREVDRGDVRGVRVGVVGSVRVGGGRDAATLLPPGRAAAVTSALMVMARRRRVAGDARAGAGDDLDDDPAGPAGPAAPVGTMPAGRVSVTVTCPVVGPALVGCARRGCTGRVFRRGMDPYGSSRSKGPAARSR